MSTQRGVSAQGVSSQGKGPRVGPSPKMSTAFSALCYGFVLVAEAAFTDQKLVNNVKYQGMFSFTLVAHKQNVC